jgi:peptidoglycan/LPS O-acetylase OafA/YrhL
MYKTWRLFLFSGLLSVFVGILHVTSLSDAKSKGMNLWGFLLMFWGILAIMNALKRFNIQWMNKLLAALGIMLHGTLVLYWLLFPEGSETKSIGAEIIFCMAGSFISAVCCIAIIGHKEKNTSSKAISK